MEPKADQAGWKLSYDSLLEAAAQDHASAGFELQYWLWWHLINGYVHKTRDTFIMAHVRDDLVPPGSKTPEPLWFIWYFRGKNRLDILPRVLPFPLEWAAWQRIRDPGRLRYFRVKRTLKLCSMGGPDIPQAAVPEAPPPPPPIASPLKQGKTDATKKSTAKRRSKSRFLGTSITAETNEQQRNSGTKTLGTF